MAAKDWKHRLKQLQDKLAVLLNSHQTVISHGMIQVRGELPGEEEQSAPPIYAAAGRVLDQIEVPLQDGVRQVHYFFEAVGEDHAIEDFNRFKQLLAGVPRLLNDIPKKNLPKVKLPPLQDRSG